jgi:5'-deoxynucleotidase YfbR-like HD superfamily hydrolase
MWPFSVSNKDIVEEKRRQRTVALAVVHDASEAQHAFLKATGSFTNFTY